MYSSDAAIAGKADAYIDARFDLLVEDASKGAPDAFAAVVKDGVKHTGDARTEADKARQDRDQSLRDAWKNTGNAA